MTRSEKPQCKCDNHDHSCMLKRKALITDMHLEIHNELNSIQIEGFNYCVQ